jgi:hypothetical protein
MKTRFKYFTYAIVLVAIVNSNSIFAQTSRTDPNDNQGWYGAKLKLDLPSGWETSLDYQARFINDFNMYNGSYTTIGAAKKIAKHIELQGDFRLALVEKGTYYRGSFGFEASNGFGDFDFGLRMLVQNQLQDFDDEYKDNQRDGYWRVKLETNYAPTVSTEPIMKFGGVRPIDNWRNIAGVKIKVAKRTKLNLFYMYRPDFAKATYNRLFQVVGVNLDYTLKIKKSNPSGHYLIAK